MNKEVLSWGVRVDEHGRRFLCRNTPGEGMSKQDAINILRLSSSKGCKWVKVKDERSAEA